MNNIYLNNYVLSYNKVNNLLYKICMNNKNIVKECIGKTAFGYNIESYTIGTGKKHVLLIGATHGCELVTVYFNLDFLLTILNDIVIQKEYTFHIIPILNPEGYIISSSNVISNLENLNEYEFEMLATKYMNVYNKCDELALQGKKIRDGFYLVLKSSINNIDNLYMRRNVGRILNSCNLSEYVLPIWTANGLGIDQNSNSIHRFKQMKNLREKQKCATLRYNIIPVTMPSPMSYPGEFTFDRSLENLSLYRYINNLDKNYDLKYIFSFHSTGGEIYGYPETCNSKKINRYTDAMNIYSVFTGYKIINENLKYGVMDYYRMFLDNTICLTIELSKFNGNPIGPYSNLIEFKEDIVKNKEAVIETIKYNF